MTKQKSSRRKNGRSEKIKIKDVLFYVKSGPGIFTAIQAPRNAKPTLIPIQRTIINKKDISTSKC
jgi:hypothetical protein